VSQVAQLYKAAASRFLQSAVIIDDRAALGPGDDEVVSDVIEDPRPRPTELTAEDTATEAKVTAELEEKAVAQGITEENRLDARALLDKFAALGIVCGVLRPGTDAAETEALALAAGGRTDMVILDWHLDDSGTLALHLLDELSQPESKRLRLVCIYTGDGGQDVSNAIASLDGNTMREEFLYQRGSTRILVLYKTGADRTGAPLERVVNVADLPERLLGEFAALCSGLVSAAAMSALGAVREAMPEMLGVLVPELDAAYVGQRLAQDRPDDAIDHLAELVVSELQSIIEDDAQFVSTADEAAVESWLEGCTDDQLTVERDALKEMNRRGGHKDVRTEIGDKFPIFQGKKKAHPTAFVVKDESASELADALLAERMTTRHRYPGARRERLELGVVVRSPDDADWRVCVQPLCDSVRLRGKTRMPFLPFLSVEEGKGFDLAIVQTPGLLRLRLAVSPSDISLVEFEPDPNENAVLAMEDDSGGRRFVDAEGRSWTLLCRLKYAHAQRIGHRLGAEFSRIGLNESEWLREKVKGKN
jgi:hypothetical protein